LEKYPQLPFQRPDGLPLGFECFAIEEQRLPSVQHHYHSFYELIVLTKGKALHEVDFNVYPLNSYEIILIKQGVVHADLKNEAKGYCLLFTADFLPEKAATQLFTNLLGTFQSPKLSLKRKEIETLLPYLQLLRQENKSTSIEASSFLLASVLLKIQSFLSHELPKEHRIVRHFLDLLEKHYATEKSLQFYAQALNSTPRSLNIHLKKGLGKTASALLQQRVALEAKRKLAYSQDTIKSIAFQLGFEDPYYFSRFFKRLTGNSPRSFRKKLR